MKSLILVFVLVFFASSCGGDKGIIHGLADELGGIGEVGEMFIFPHNGCASYSSEVSNKLRFNDVCNLVTFENGGDVMVLPGIVGEEMTLENGYGFIEKVVDIDLSFGLLDEVGEFSVGKHIVKFGVTKDLLTGLMDMEIEVFKADEIPVETVTMVTTVTEVVEVEVEVSSSPPVTNEPPSNPEDPCDEDEDEDEDEDDDKDKKCMKYLEKSRDSREDGDDDKADKYMAKFKKCTEKKKYKKGKKLGHYKHKHEHGHDHE